MKGKAGCWCEHSPCAEGHLGSTGAGPGKLYVGIYGCNISSLAPQPSLPRKLLFLVAPGPHLPSTVPAFGVKNHMVVC